MHCLTWSLSHQTLGSSAICSSEAEYLERQCYITCECRNKPTKMNPGQNTKAFHEYKQNCLLYFVFIIGKLHASATLNNNQASVEKNGYTKAWWWAKWTETCSLRIITENILLCWAVIWQHICWLLKIQIHYTPARTTLRTNLIS
jgi:hypothetical protein